MIGSTRLRRSENEVNERFNFVDDKPFSCNNVRVYIKEESADVNNSITGGNSPLAGKKLRN